MSPVEYTPSKRGRILQLHDLNYSYGQIADITGASKTAAYETVKRDENYHTCNSLPRSGRPPAVNERERRHVIQDIRKHRFDPYKAVAERVGGVSERQVRRIANDAGYHRRIAVRKPFLTAAAVKKRIKWAEENESRNWSTIIWTDESTIELGKRPGHQRVTRLPGEEYLPENLQPTFHSGRKSLMVWGAIAHGHKGPLIKLNMEEEMEENAKGKGKKKGRGLNGAKYVSQVLRGPLGEFCEEVEMQTGCEVLVVEDGAPGHTSKVAKQARAELGIKTLTHPPKSPDLNPIEPLWHLLKIRIADIPGSGNSLDNLWAAAQRVWDELTADDIRKHTGKMKDRVEAIKHAKGWHTKF
jgi:transposase